MSVAMLFVDCEVRWSCFFLCSVFFFGVFFFFFFFQAEDGIRDRDVTGVQTCALPISCIALVRGASGTQSDQHGFCGGQFGSGVHLFRFGRSLIHRCLSRREARVSVFGRSEERRVGKECRSRWSSYH